MKVALSTTLLVRTVQPIVQFLKPNTNPTYLCQYPYHILHASVSSNAEETNIAFVHVLN